MFLEVREGWAAAQAPDVAGSRQHRIKNHPGAVQSSRETSFRIAGASLGRVESFSSSSAASVLRAPQKVMKLGESSARRPAHPKPEAIRLARAFNLPDSGAPGRRWPVAAG
jgi:hypothetical protein